MKDKEFFEFTATEVERLVNKPYDDWSVSDKNTICLLLGMLMGKLQAELLDIERNLITHTCCICSRHFKSKYKNKKYCSDACKSKSYRDRQ